MTSLVVHIQVYLANSYSIWKNEFCFLNSSEHTMFFPYYENYASHNVKWYLLFIYFVSLEVRALPHAYLHASSLKQMFLQCWLL